MGVHLLESGLLQALHRRLLELGVGGDIDQGVANQISDLDALSLGQGVSGSVIGDLSSGGLFYNVFEQMTESAYRQHKAHLSHNFHI